MLLSSELDSLSPTTLVAKNPFLNRYKINRSTKNNMVKKNKVTFAITKAIAYQKDMRNNAEMTLK